MLILLLILDKVCDQSLGLVALKYYIRWFSGRNGQATQTWIKLVSINWCELSPLGRNSGTRTNYSLDWINGSVWNTAYVTKYEDMQLKVRRYNGRNFVSITIKVIMLVRIAKLIILAFSLSSIDYPVKHRTTYSSC